MKDGKTAVIRPAGTPADDVLEAIGGGAIIVNGGKVSCGKDVTLAPRTAVGITATGNVVFYECDGRQAPDSCGMTVYQVAETMRALGCVTAMNLDGGGSSTFVTRRESDNSLAIRNKPCYISERPVSTSLMVCSTATATNVFDHVAFTSDNYLCNPRSYVKVTAKGVDKNGFTTSIPEGGKMVLSSADYGKLSGNRFVAAGKEGTVRIDYVIGETVYGTTTVEITKEADDAITAFFKNIIQTFLNLYQLFTFAMDKIFNSNGLPLY